MKYEPIKGVRVVGITGHARHGKDTFAMALMRSVPGAERWAFSDLISCFERLNGRMAQRDARHLQSTLGTIDRPLLLMAMYEAIRDHRPPLAIITGLRKPDEIALVKGMGGEIIRIVRTLPGGGVYQSSDRDPNHPVEQDIDGIPADLMFASPDVETLERCAKAYVGGLVQ